MNDNYNFGYETTQNCEFWNFSKIDYISTKPEKNVQLFGL